MKKTLLLATVATVAFTMNANAGVLTPYVSAKLSAAKLDVNQSSREIMPGGAQEVTRVIRNFQSYDDSKRVWGTSFAAGVSYGLEGGAIRTELEWQRNTAARMNNTYAVYHDDGEAYSSRDKIKTHAYMLNAYYDFDTCTKFTPYVGAGIGLAKTKIAHHGTMIDEFDMFRAEGTAKHTGIAWQIGAGIAYALNDNVSVDVGYRYIDYGKFKDSSLEDRGPDEVTLSRTSYETTANELYAGLRYSF